MALVLFIYFVHFLITFMDFDFAKAALDHKIYIFVCLFYRFFGV